MTTDTNKVLTGRRPLPPPRDTTSPDNSSVLLMSNNNTYIDFRTAYKHILIPSYYNEVI